MHACTLDPRSIAETVERLRQRVDARFPEAGLGRVAEKQSLEVGQFIQVLEAGGPCPV